MTTLDLDDLEDLARARELLEHESLAVRFQSALGRPIEEGMKWLPESWTDTVHQSVEAALGKGLEFAIRSLHGRPARATENLFHKALVATSGAAGGALGLFGLPIELPVSTVIMLRSIADIARSEGEDLTAVETRLACLQVFALGGRATGDDSAETGYYVVRALLSQQIAEAARALAGSGTLDRGMPAMVRLMASIASRFGVVVSQKTVATAIPILGAAGGALLNTMFIDHFQDAARGHFIIRRLERKYGAETVEAAYAALGAADSSPAE